MQEAATIRANFIVQNGITDEKKVKNCVYMPPKKENPSSKKRKETQDCQISFSHFCSFFFFLKTTSHPQQLIFHLSCQQLATKQCKPKQTAFATLLIEAIVTTPHPNLPIFLPLHSSFHLSHVVEQPCFLHFSSFLNSTTKTSFLQQNFYKGMFSCSACI